MSFAIVFPGQGSQSVGMLSALAQSEPLVADTFAEASAVLGYDLGRLVSEGPEDDLNQTQRTQPAMLAAGVAVWRVWQARGGPRPKVMAGHSLGEYTALVCAGALGFTDAIALVARRGELMQAAVGAGDGAMAAVLGLDDAAVREVCAQSTQDQVVEAVNFNAPGQVVVAGHRAAVDRAVNAAKAAGAKRAVLLPVSVPSHCALMAPAAQQLAHELEKIAIAAPQIPVINNVDVESCADPEAIKQALARQLHNPVRWVETINKIAAMNISQVLEFGPGKVLAGLNKRINRDMTATPVFDEQSLTDTLATIGAQ